MSNVDEIKAAIEALPEPDFAALRRWFSEKDWGNWDQQLEADARAGKLDFLLEEARDEKANGRLKEL